MVAWPVFVRHMSGGVVFGLWSSRSRLWAFAVMWPRYWRIARLCVSVLEARTVTYYMGPVFVSLTDLRRRQERESDIQGWGRFPEAPPSNPGGQ